MNFTFIPATTDNMNLSNLLAHFLTSALVTSPIKAKSFLALPDSHLVCLREEISKNAHLLRFDKKWFCSSTGKWWFFSSTGKCLTSLELPITPVRSFLRKVSAVVFSLADTFDWPLKSVWNSNLLLLMSKVAAGASPPRQNLV